MSWDELLAAADEIRATAVIADPWLDGLALAGLGWATVEAERAFVELDSLFTPADAGASWAPVGRDPVLGARAWLRTTAGSPGSPWLVVLEPYTEGRIAAALARFGEGVAAIYLGEGAIRPGRLVRGGPVWGPHVVILGGTGDAPDDVASPPRPSRRRSSCDSRTHDCHHHRGGGLRHHDVGRPEHRLFEGE